MFYKLTALQHSRIQHEALLRKENLKNKWELANNSRENKYHTLRMTKKREKGAGQNVLTEHERKNVQARDLRLW